MANGINMSIYNKKLKRNICSNAIFEECLEIKGYHICIFIASIGR